MSGQQPNGPDLGLTPVHGKNADPSAKAAPAEVSDGSARRKKRKISGTRTQKPRDESAGRTARRRRSGRSARDIVPVDPPPVMAGMHLVATVQDVPEWITRQTGRIPPGWRYVQVAEEETAEKLVTGYDYEGRLQIRYSTKHIQDQAEEKFRRVEALHEHEEAVTAGIRRIRNEDVRDCLLLIMKTGLRPGSTESARNGHFGATTLLADHVVIEKSRVLLRFIGKEGVLNEYAINDPGLRRMLRRRKKTAEKRADRRLFETSPDTLNRQLKAAVHGFSASVKDLRTMRACETANMLLQEEKPAETARDFARLRNQVGLAVSKVLGNGRDIALASYIDPQIFAAHSPVGYRLWQEAKAGQADGTAADKPLPESERALHQQRDGRDPDPADKPHQKRLAARAEQFDDVGIEPDRCHCHHDEKLAECFQRIGDLSRQMENCGDE